MSHTPEPWEVWTSNSHIRISSCGRDGDVCCATIASDGMAVLSISIADAERIVACINACAGLPQDALDGGWTAAGISQYAKKLEQQRDELLAALVNLLNVSDEPPDSNCSCHISPPCNDCVDNGGMREVIQGARSAIAKAKQS